MTATNRDMWGDLRAAAQRRDLSGLDLSSAVDGKQGEYREYLCGLPAEVLATGARWDIEGWGDSLEGEHTLSVCGMEWWVGETWEHGQRWCLRERRRVLPIFEREHPDDDRPRRAIEALERYLDDRTGENGRAWDDARGAARAVGGAAASAAASAAAWGAARVAARVAAWSAASAAARGVASVAARAAARATAWDAAWAVGRARQEREWMVYMLQEVA